MIIKCFNPYSPGFSIYLIDREVYMLCLEKLQSLFTWIFYLFFKSASLLAFFLGCFNPYSPGFSIYLNKCFDWEGCYTWLQSLFTWIFYLFTNRFQQTRRSKNASILIHLDFLSIYWFIWRENENITSFNPYSPGFSIYLKK